MTSPSEASQVLTYVADLLGELETQRLHLTFKGFKRDAAPKLDELAGAPDAAEQVGLNLAAWADQNVFGQVPLTPDQRCLIYGVATVLMDKNRLGPSRAQIFDGAAITDDELRLSGALYASRRLLPEGLNRLVLQGDDDIRETFAKFQLLLGQDANDRVERSPDYVQLPGIIRAQIDDLASEARGAVPGSGKRAWVNDAIEAITEGPKADRALVGVL